jgi:uncharacterized membrane protein
MILGLAFVALYVGHSLMAAWSFLALRRFLAETPVIASQDDLRRYKDLVRVQMYLALVGIGVLLSGLVLGIGLTSRYGCVGLVLVLAGSAWLFGVGIFLKRVEVRARSLPVTGEGLADEYRRVSEAWVKKPLPDFPPTRPGAGSWNLKTSRTRAAAAINIIGPRTATHAERADREF